MLAKKKKAKHSSSNLVLGQREGECGLGNKHRRGRNGALDDFEGAVGRPRERALCDS